MSGQPTTLLERALNAGLSGEFNVTAALKEARVVMPATSYHMDSTGRHVPGFNEMNPGVGVSIPVSSESGSKLNLELASYTNSYANTRRFAGDRTHYAALSQELASVDVGRLRASVGVMAGLATTDKGSYAAAAPQLSHKSLNVTLMGGITAAVEDKPTGWGVRATIVPALDKKSVGFVGVALTRKFSF